MNNLPYYPRGSQFCGIVPAEIQEVPFTMFKPKIKEDLHLKHGSDLV